MRFLQDFHWSRCSFAVGCGNSSPSKMKLHLRVIASCIVVVFILYQITNFQYLHTKIETKLHPFVSSMESHSASTKIDYLPRGIVQASSDMELKPLWPTKRPTLKDDDEGDDGRGLGPRNLLAMSAGLEQRGSVDLIVRKFLPENFTVILFHYDGNVDAWRDLHWSTSAIHVSALNQTKWWFAKRFLHPDVVSIYDYIFLWDEDLGVENFHPGRYLNVVKSEGLEISQPALDPRRSEIHHKITTRKEGLLVHRKVQDNVRCPDSEAPPCTGWVEGMAPVFSRSAWRCAWHLIQNDLIHGWGMDMKLGYCAQGDRRKKVGVVDSEFVVHWGIRTLGGSSSSAPKRIRGMSRGDVRVESRRRAKSELRIFQDRWDEAAREDPGWVDPFRHTSSRRRRQRRRQSPPDSAAEEEEPTKAAKEI
ncbi:unnamed protein product [Spirodela intermedia]|uniref:Uncharacterized protein n=1 Tax=Spirodela intermedia TaxID=51605 RepID=A0A7I8L8X4_SPIIN|nr:unnamed protein product [Spirodela intermedia]